MNFQVEQPFDKTKNERKNFCFITFAKEESAKQLLKAGSTTVNGVELEVKKVTPNPDPRLGMAFMGRGGGRGGFNGNPYGPYGDYYGYGYGDPYFAGGWAGYGGYGGGGWGFDQYGGKGGAKGGAPRGGGQVMEFSDNLFFLLPKSKFAVNTLLAVFAFEIVL